MAYILLIHKSDNFKTFSTRWQAFRALVLSLLASTAPAMKSYRKLISQMLDMVACEVVCITPDHLLIDYEECPC